MSAKSDVDDIVDGLKELSVEAPKPVVKTEKDDDGYNSSNSEEIDNVKREASEEADEGVEDVKNVKKDEEEEEVELQPLSFAVESVEPEHIILISRGPIDHDSHHNR